MGLLEGGGFVLTTSEGNWSYQASVSVDTLRKIADLLSMPPDVKAKVPDARSIHVFRGRFVPGGAKS